MSLMLTGANKFFKYENLLEEIKNVNHCFDQFIDGEKNRN